MKAERMVKGCMVQAKPRDMPRGLESCLLAAVLMGLVLSPSVAQADPCGMVPPIYPNDTIPPLARTGAQKTYVFYQDGIETFVIRPGYEGKVEDFGMLIPFPSVPALRKVSDNIFPHIARAIDPPEVVVDLRRKRSRRFSGGMGGGRAQPAAESLSVARDEVRVVKEEAVGMYEVAVLQAGSAGALKKWMDEHGYTYPDGMDDACNDYVEDRWCFVAVKTRVVAKSTADPKPGQRTVQPQLPPESAFDGHVQAMGFRFRVDELVVPMRLSAFNKGELHNIVYLLTDEPSRIRGLPSKHVVRQVPGAQLFKNVTEPLPLRVLGGTIRDIPEARKQRLEERRDPVPHNGAARDLFAADLMAARSHRLAHPHEEREKELLRIGEALTLRGPELDKLHKDVLEARREQVARALLEHLEGMTLTVIDGDFPRDYLSENNLKFARYEMPAEKNTPAVYDAARQGPAPEREGRLYYGPFSRITPETPERIPAGFGSWGVGLIASAVFLGLAAVVVRRKGHGTVARLVWPLGLTIGVLGVLQGAVAEEGRPRTSEPLGRLRQELDKPSPETDRVDAAVEELIDRGQRALPELSWAARHDEDVAVRGWAIVALSRIGGQSTKRDLTRLHRDQGQPDLVRTWAGAARIQLAESTSELIDLARTGRWQRTFPPLERPLRLKLRALLSSSGDSLSAEKLLTLNDRVPALQGVLAPAILSLGREALLEEMLTAADNDVRRRAAAYLATLAQENGAEKVVAAVTGAYRFDVEADQVPWAGGALFLPSLEWTEFPEKSRQLVGHLVSWHLWLEINQPKGPQGRSNARNVQRQIFNNLRSRTLAEAAGYDRPNHRQRETNELLLFWGRTVGREAVEKILKQQGVARHARYRRILEQLP